MADPDRRGAESQVRVVERLSYGNSIVGAQELTSGDPQQNGNIDVSEQLKFEFECPLGAVCQVSRPIG